MLRLSTLLPTILLEAYLLQNGAEVLGLPVSWVPAYKIGPAKLSPEAFQPEFEEGDFHEGDIILNPLKGLNAGVKNLVADRSLLWPGGVLYYQLSNEFSEAEKNWIRAAVADLQSVTCVRIVESPGAGAYMLVRNLNGCAAPVGYYGIKTDMYLSATGCRSFGTIQHEFLHVLGFWHEHTRPDRDNHVQIMWQNIRPGRTGNFLARSPQESQYEGMPYDYGSVMHYRAVAFSRDGSPTIVPLQPSAQIGQRFRYSMIDLAKLNRLYGCGTGFYQGKSMYGSGEEVEEEAEKKEEVSEEEKEEKKEEKIEKEEKKEEKIEKAEEKKEEKKEKEVKKEEEIEKTEEKKEKNEEKKEEKFEKKEENKEKKEEKKGEKIEKTEEKIEKKGEKKNGEREKEEEKESSKDKEDDKRRKTEWNLKTETGAKEGDPKRGQWVSSQDIGRGKSEAIVFRER